MTNQQLLDRGYVRVGLSPKADEQLSCEECHIWEFHGEMGWEAMYRSPTGRILCEPCALRDAGLNRTSEIREEAK